MRFLNKPVVLTVASLILVGCGRNSVPAKSVTVVDTIQTIDTLRITEIQGGEAFYEYTVHDTIKEFIKTPCPPQVVKARKYKVKDSYNYIGEINELKRSNQIKDSKIDSLNMQLGKKCVGNQTNNGSKWWIFVLLGMGIGVTGYQAIRSAITKKI